MLAAIGIRSFLPSSLERRHNVELVDRDMFDLKLWLPTQAAIERTRTEVEAIESLLREDPAIRRVDWLIGGSFPSVYYNAVMNQDNARHHAQAVVTARSSEEVKRLIPVIQRRLDEAFPQHRS